MSDILPAIGDLQNWIPVIAVIALRAFVKWNQAGRPNGFVGFLTSLISFVPSPGPQPTPGPQPSPDPVDDDPDDDEEVRPIEWVVEVVLPALLDILRRTDPPAGVSQQDWEQSKQAIEGPVLRTLLADAYEQEELGE